MNSKHIRWLGGAGAGVGMALTLGLILTFGADKTGLSTNPDSPQKKTLNLRQPAVAGLFYPAEKAELSRQIDEYLAAAPKRTVTNLRAVICPHAGYEYSGPVAAQAYKLLAGSKYKTVVILAPSHYAMFQGGSIPETDAYATPLGWVEISEKARILSKTKPFLMEPRCLVQRPAWWRQSSKKAPVDGADTPDTWEHSAEVQVPFLQKTLQNFKILPVIFGEADPVRAARVLAEHLDDDCLIVASTDLSHYHPYAEAAEMDNRCVTDICSLNPEKLKRDEACGMTPVLTLVHLARLKGWRAERLDYRNSGDTAGDKSRVVGYAAIAFYAPPPEPSALSTDEKKQLLQLARKTLQETVKSGRLPNLEAPGSAAKFTENKGCFVTLTKNGELRGCIGHILPQEPLWQAIMDNARNAALRDPRFNPVTPAEAGSLEIEISVLTAPQPLAFSSPEDLLGKLQPHRDGVVLEVQGQGSTFLPQVWEQLPDKVEFLEHLSQKAGRPKNAWRESGTKVSIYRVEAFKESELTKR